MKKCVGVDIGGTSAKMGLFNEDGALLDKWDIPTRTEENGKHILPDIAASIKTKLGEHGIELGELIGVGMGIPGPMANERSATDCYNLGLINVTPVQELEELLGGVHAAGTNDANAAALGEQWKGGGQGYNSIAAVTLGTGVGCGIILDGKIVPGSRGQCGELGHTVVNREETERCNCGNYGCLETYASATGIVRVAKRHLAASEAPSVLRDLAVLTAKDVVDAARDGDKLADEALTESMDWLAFGLAHLTYAVDPDIFVIGGGVSKAGDFLLEKIRKPFAGYTYMSKDKTPILLAKLGSDAGIYGAARLILQSRG